jgi:acetyl esterase/lipase
LGIVGFSAGGQVAARLLSSEEQKSYDRVDEADQTSHRPDFAILVYPWNMYDAKQDALVEGIQVAKNCPPTFVVHTHDDHSSSLGAVLFYAGLKKHNIPAEFHVYGNGGHGYGLRPRKDSEISTWPSHAAHWLGTQGLLD